MTIGIISSHFDADQLFPDRKPTTLFRQVPNPGNMEQTAGCDALLDLDGQNAGSYPAGLPLLIASTDFTFRQFSHLPEKAARFCGWPGFAARACWEMAVRQDSDTGWLAEVMEALGKTWKLVKDEPGLVAPRILATIINEACYTLDAGVSTAEEIDMAMQLGTNYPKGPFAWGREIGFEKIAVLLDALAAENDKYKPHPLLHQL